MDGPWDKYSSSTMTAPDNSQEVQQVPTEDNSGPWDKYASNTETAPSPEQPSNDSSGLVGTTLGALGSGLMKGSEAILNTEQGATNIVGNTLSTVTGGAVVPPSQIFSDTSKDIENTRVKLFGNQQSVHGKVLENLGQLPALIAMIGSPQKAGLLGVPASLESFAGQAALQTQPQVQGKPLTEQLGSMAWAGTKAAAFGAVLGKAMKMTPVSGAALAGAYSATTSALAGEDPNDVLAGAISAAGLVTLSNPKILANTLTSIGKKAVEGASNTAEQLKTKGPLTTGANIVGAKVNDTYQEIHSMLDSQDKINDIDQKIAQAKTENQVTQENLDNNAKLLKTQADQEKSNIESDTEGTLSELDKQKSMIQRNVSNILTQKGIEVSNAINGASKELAGNIDSTVTGLKSGKLKQFFNNISTAFVSATDSMAELFNKSSTAPLTRFDGIDAANHALEQIANANGNIDGTSPTAQALNKMISFLKESPLKNSTELQGDLAKRVSDLRTMKVPEKDIQKYIDKEQGGGKIDLTEPVPLKTIKGLFDRAKQADPYGSHEGDIANKAFASLIEKKLSDNGQDTTQFRKIMSDMSTAISYKTRLSSIFQLKQGAAYNESGFKFLNEIATGKDEFGKVINPSQGRLLDVLQKGLSIGDINAEGTGDISSSLIKMGDNLDKLQEQYKNIGYKEKATIANIGKNFVTRIAQAKSQGKLTQERVDLEHKRTMETLTQIKNSLDSNVDSQINEFKGDRAKQEELLARKKDIASTIGVMGLTVSVYASKIGYGFRAISKLASRNATGLGKRP